jgi:hypothetical protein
MKPRYVFWQEDEVWLAYLEECPDCWTQAETEAELKENLADIYRNLRSGALPRIRRVAELEVV